MDKIPCSSGIYPMDATVVQYLQIHQVIHILKKKKKEGCKLVQALWRTVWRFLLKLKLELSYDPAVPFLGIYVEKTVI